MKDALGVQLAAGTYHAGGALYELPPKLGEDEGEGEGEGDPVNMGKVLPEDLIKKLLEADTHMAIECSVNYVDRVNSYVVKRENGEDAETLQQRTLLCTSINWLPCVLP